MASLGEQLRQIAERNKVKLETAVRKTVLDLGSSIVQATPVDSGRLRGSWVYGNDAKPTEQPDTPDKAGGVSTRRIQQGVDGWRAGQTMWIVTNLPYAYRIEYEGWSKQAPAGMVRTTIANFEAHFAKALGEVR